MRTNRPRQLPYAGLELSLRKSEPWPMLLHGGGWRWALAANTNGAPWQSLPIFVRVAWSCVCYQRRSFAERRRFDFFHHNPAEQTLGGAC